MTLYVNGYNTPEFRTWVPGSGWQVTRLELKYHNFIEKIKRNFYHTKTKAGTIYKKFKYTEYEWQIDHKTLIESGQLQKFIKVLHWLELDYTTILYPHHDQPRSFDVIDTSENLDLIQYGGIDSFGNQGLEFSFATRRPVNTPGSSIKWYTISDPNIPETEFSQNNYLQTESGDYILSESGELILIE